MRMHAEREGGALRLVFGGCPAIDSVNAAAVKAEALRLIAEATDVIVDLSGVEFIDSAGVGVLVGLFKALRQRGGRARFCGLSAGVRSVIEIIRLDRIFEIYDDAASAASA